MIGKRTSITFSIREVTFPPIRVSSIGLSRCSLMLSTHFPREVEKLLLASVDCAFTGRVNIHNPKIQAITVKIYLRKVIFIIVRING
jgi:hypothetical protein